MNEPMSPQALKPRLRRVSLAFMGEEWKDTYALFRYLTWEDTKQIREEAKKLSGAESDDVYIDATINTVKQYLADGKVLNASDELVDLTADLVDGFDLDAIQVLYQRLMGVPDPNASSPSAAS